MRTLDTKRLILHFLFLGLSPVAPLLAASPVYDFTGLNPGFLAGQDGWAVHPTFPTSSLELFAKTPGEADLACRHAGQGGQVLYRYNDAGFSFPPFAAGETNAVMYADFLVRVQAGQYNALVGVASDSTDAGATISSISEIAPQFGLLSSATSTQGQLSFVIRASGEGTISFQPLGDYARHNEWVRLKFAMNLQAGTGTLYLRNLTRVETTYTALPNCANVPLLLSRMNPDCPPGSWNALYLRMTSDLAPTEARASLVVDNILPHEIVLNEVSITRVTPPNWLKLHFDSLRAGRTYEVQSKSFDGFTWFPELTFTAIEAAQTIELPVTPETYGSREFRLILTP